LITEYSSLPWVVKSLLLSADCGAVPAAIVIDPPVLDPELPLPPDDDELDELEDPPHAARASIATRARTVVPTDPRRLIDTSSSEGCCLSATQSIGPERR
jgi:hypothetical protein